MSESPSDQALYTIGARVTLRPAVLDPQGQAILRGLHALDFPAIEDVQAGKYFRLSVRAANLDEALATASDACERLLANLVIERFVLTPEGTT
ncbi:MAG TPA: phosphoribosylformylglycinamidine synthase subunit PurS [Chloroflexota bacterium]|nr:phosphoribosylformylglycinamidine synthase subunit PurS [Chloroflexota bacterium]